LELDQDVAPDAVRRNETRTAADGFRRRTILRFPNDREHVAVRQDFHVVMRQALLGVQRVVPDELAVEREFLETPALPAAREAAERLGLAAAAQHVAVVGEIDPGARHELAL